MRFDYTAGVSVAVDDLSQVGEARRTATAVATAAGLNGTDAGRAALIASEAATNIVKHASRGELILRSTASGRCQAIEIIAIDAGPGILDVAEALRDGFSTAGSGGTGLGAISRLATTFDIFSRPASGTVIAARVETDHHGDAPARPTFDVGVVRVPKRGETECGDDWGIVYGDGRALLTVADGLGHGVAAADASRRAIVVAEERASDSPALVLGALHAALRPTRGAAVAVAALDAKTRSLTYAGIGNISAVLAGVDRSRSLVSHNGIVGHEIRKIQEFSCDWPAGTLLVMHSDGVSARWDLGTYPGLAMHHPGVVAGVLYRDFSRRRDDALVVVVRITD